MNEPKIIGIVFEHGPTDYALWLTDAINDEDQEALKDILENSCFTGCSVRNCYEQIQKIMS